MYAVNCKVKEQAISINNNHDIGIGDYVRRKSGRKNQGRVINIFQGNSYSRDGSFKGHKWYAKVRWENVYQHIGGGTSMAGTISLDSLVKVEGGVKWKIVKRTTWGG